MNKRNGVDRQANNRPQASQTEGMSRGREEGRMSSEKKKKMKKKKEDGRVANNGRTESGKDGRMNGQNQTVGQNE